MSAKTEIPSEGSFAFVLRRYDYDPTTPQRVVGYRETATSRNIKFGGVAAPTIFVRGKAFAERAEKLGWVNISDLWFGRAEVSVDAGVAKLDPVSVVSDSDESSVITAPDSKAPRRRRVKRRKSSEG